MQKSKNTTIIIIIFLICYFFLNQIFLNDLGNIYTFIINPLSFIVIAVLLKIFIISPYRTDKFKKDIIQYVLITMLLYAIIYLVSGFFTGYGKNPYSTSIRGIIINLFVSGTIFCSIEYIRFKLIHNVYKEDTNIIFIFLVITFVIWDFNFFKFMTEQINVYTLFKTIFYRLIPIVIKNILFTYMALKTDYIPAIIYNLVYYMILWISPILPNSPWILEAIINIIFPLILLLYIRYYINKKDRFNFNRMYKESNPMELIPFSILLVLLIWFALGVFPIKPVGIATESMYPEIKVGDAVIIQKCTANDIEIQDIIEYQMEGYTVVHRVVNKYNTDGETFFITKGDNNNNEDALPVSENKLIGKVIFKIPYIALPAVWLHAINSQEVVEIETGK